MKSILSRFTSRRQFRSAIDKVIAEMIHIRRLIFSSCGDGSCSAMRYWLAEIVGIYPGTIMNICPVFSASSRLSLCIGSGALPADRKIERDRRPCGALVSRDFPLE